MGSLLPQMLLEERLDCFIDFELVLLVAEAVAFVLFYEVE